MFAADVMTERGYEGPILEVIAESGRAVVFYMDMDLGIKQVSRDETSVQREVVSFHNDAFPELELDQVEVQLRDIIPVEGRSLYFAITRPPARSLS